MANSSIDLVGLDFQTIKNNLKNYLKNNSAFKDVDYEASNINVMLDLLSYNTYLNSFYTNMVASEMFIDTAQLRDSVVSHAKSLNYLPKSFVSASCEIRIDITPPSPVTNVVIPKGTTFTSKVGSNTFTFSTFENTILNSSNGGVFSTNLTLYEGTYVTDSFVMNYSNTSQRFVISNPTVDISSISVTVFEESDGSSSSYIKSDTLAGMSSTTKAFYLEAAENQQYEIKFGDNVFGKKPNDSSVIVVEYRISSGELPNGASVFLNDGNIDGISNVSITTVSKATGGAIAESIESIRYNAPRNFQIQSRAVTTSDYETLLKSNFSEIESISAYGGEDLVPPQFGKVFISVDVKNADGTPENRKRVYSDFISNKTPLTITPVFVDPIFMYVKIDSIVKYNVNATTKTSGDIKALVLSKISNFNTTNLNSFKKTLFYSQLSREIDSADASIVSNDTLVKAIKIITPTLSKNQSLEVVYGFEFEKETGIDLTEEEYHYGHTVQSSPFIYGGKRSIIVDDTRGGLYIGILKADQVELGPLIGTVDYINGILKITRIKVDSYEGSGIKIYVRSKSKDFSSSKNSILAIDDADVTVDAIPVKL